MKKRRRRRPVKKRLEFTVPMIEIIDLDPDQAVLAACMEGGVWTDTSEQCGSVPGSKDFTCITAVRGVGGSGFVQLVETQSAPS